ncbi:MAG: hypothetical protein A4E28_01014 [Methanocella sp. PtaU1.Bin125]|nr:MAG: hypothetical protein A4E28_01014 [Methanocella sp. PtaU1.Bin125]
MSNEAIQRAMLSIWWQVLLRGVISLLLGLLMIFWPNASVRAYEEIFGVYALVDGLLLIMHVAQVRQVDRKASSRLLHGVIGVGFGAAIFLWPEFRQIGMANIFSTYVMLTGALQVFTALDLHQVVRYDYYFIASGLMSIVCGLLLKTTIAGDVVLLARIFGTFMTAYAVIVVLIAFEMRRGTGKGYGRPA